MLVNGDGSSMTSTIIPFHVSYLQRQSFCYIQSGVLAKGTVQTIDVLVKNMDWNAQDSANNVKAQHDCVNSHVPDLEESDIEEYRPSD